MTTRTVTGTVKHLDNTAWVGGTISFRLAETFSTATEVVPRDTIEEVLDSNGQFSITLEVPDTGTAHYFVTLPDTSQYEFYLASGAATDLMTILTISGSSVAQDDLQTLLDTYKALTNTLVTTSSTVSSGYDLTRAYGDITLTLPLASGSGGTFRIKNVGNYQLPGTLTIVPQAGDYIDGKSYILVGIQQTVLFYDYSPTVWLVIN